MYEIIQMEDGSEAIIDSKDTLAEAEDYVSALNDRHDQELVQFFYREIIKSTITKSKDNEIYGKNSSGGIL